MSNVVKRLDQAFGRWWSPDRSSTWHDCGWINRIRPTFACTSPHIASRVHLHHLLHPWTPRRPKRSHAFPSRTVDVLCGRPLRRQRDGRIRRSVLDDRGQDHLGLCRCGRVLYHADVHARPGCSASGWSLAPTFDVRTASQDGFNTGRTGSRCAGSTAASAERHSTHSHRRAGATRFRHYRDGPDSLLCKNGTPAASRIPTSWSVSLSSRVQLVPPTLDQPALRRHRTPTNRYRRTRAEDQADGSRCWHGPRPISAAWIDSRDSLSPGLHTSSATWSTITTHAVSRMRAATSCSRRSTMSVSKESLVTRIAPSQGRIPPGSAFA